MVQSLVKEVKLGYDENGKVIPVSMTLNFTGEQIELMKENKEIFGLKDSSSDTLVYRISSSEIIEATQLDWEMNKRIYNSVFRKISVYQNQILELSFTNALERTARVLVNLCKQYGIVQNDGVRINIHFTHSDIASMVNTSRVTVSNLFTYFAENSYIHKQDRYCVVNSVQKLEEIANGGIDLNRYSKGPLNGLSS